MFTWMNICSQLWFGFYFAYLNKLAKLWSMFHTHNILNVCAQPVQKQPSYGMNNRFIETLLWTERDIYPISPCKPRIGAN